MRRLSRPGDGVEAGLGNRLTAITTHPESAFFNPLQGLVDGLQNLRVRLLQAQVNVHFVVTRRLVGHVALPSIVVLHGRLDRTKASGLFELRALLEKRLAVGRHVHDLLHRLAPRAAPQAAS